MKQLIAQIKESIYGPEYYQEILTRPISSSLKYYGGFAMLLALVVTIISSVPLVPLINKTLHAVPQSFLAYYPDQLEVRVQNGHATTTVVEPYFLPLPQILKSTLATNTDIFSLGVIDTKTPFVLEKFQEYHAFFWVAENAIAIRDQNGAIRISPFGRDMTLTLNKQMMREFIAQIEPFFAFVAPIAILAIFIGMIVVFTLNLIPIIFSALFVFLMGMLLKRGWTYSASFRLTLHAVTLPLLLSTIFSLVTVNHVGDLPFFSTILILLVVFFNTKTIETDVASHEAPTPPLP